MQAEVKVKAEEKEGQDEGEVAEVSVAVNEVQAEKRERATGFASGFRRLFTKEKDEEQPDAADIDADALERGLESKAERGEEKAEEVVREEKEEVPSIHVQDSSHSPRSSSASNLLLRAGSSTGSSILAFLHGSTGSEDGRRKSSKVQGLLHVVVHQASGISPSNPIAPSCRLVTKHQSVRTRPVPRTSQPIWEEQLALFVLATDEDRLLTVEVVHPNGLGLGYTVYSHTSLSLEDLVMPMEFNRVSMWLDLFRQSQAKGRIRISITYRSLQSAQEIGRGFRSVSSTDSFASSGLSSPATSATDLTAYIEGLSDDDDTRMSGENRELERRDSATFGRQKRRRDNFGFPVEEEGRRYSSFSTKQFLSNHCKEWEKWGADRATVVAAIRRSGIPHCHRAEVWAEMTGVNQHKWDQPDRVNQLLSDYVGMTSAATEQIDKDLDRTFPGHAIFQHPLGRESLKRVLVAFSWSDAFVGYCQSMNFIAGFLLLVLTEEDAFWVLRKLVQDVVPLYFSPSLTGCRAAQLVLVELIAVQMPQAHMHLQESMFSIQFLTLEWFMRLFIGIVSTECSLRIMDYLLCDGPDILFGVALALLRSLESQLEVVDSFDELFFMMRAAGQSYDNPNALIKSALEELSLIEEGLLAKSKAKYHDAMVTESHDDDVRSLLQSAKFTQEEMEKLHSHFNMVVKRRNLEDTGMLDRETFGELLGTLYTNPGIDIIEKLFKIFDRKGTGCIDFHEFLCGMCAMSKGTVEEKLHLAFRVFDVNDDGFLDAQELCLMFGVQQMMYLQESGVDVQSPVADDAAIETLVRQFDVHGNGKLDFDEFCECLRQPPYALLASQLQMMATTRGLQGAQLSLSADKRQRARDGRQEGGSGGELLTNFELGDYETGGGEGD